MYSFSFIILALLILGFWWIFGREKIGKPYANNLMKLHAKTPWDIGTLWISRAIGIILILIALWGIMDKGGHDTLLKEKETVFVLDISKSMETDDLSPSRLEKAKDLIRKKIENDGGWKGYVIFAGKTFILAPLSGDTSGMIHIVSSTTTDTIDQSIKDTSGTNIGDALITSIGLFSSGVSERHIYLFTDGRANIGLDPSLAIDELLKNNITLSTVAVGSSSGATLSYRDVTGKRVPLLDASGSVQPGNVDHAYLESLAKKGGGKSYRIERDQDSIENMGSGDIPDDIPDFSREYQVLFLALCGLLTICLNWIVPYRYKRR